MNIQFLSLETLLAQKKIDQIQGINNTWFCGSYCGYGFHEDGIQSAAYVANLLDVKFTLEKTCLILLIDYNIYKIDEKYIHK